MSLAEVDEQYEALTLALTEAKMAPVGHWEARAVNRMADRRAALARMAALTANEEGGPEINPEIALEFRAVLSWQWRPGAADLLSLPELLRSRAALYADKAEEDARLRARGIGEPVSLIRYLCEKAAPPPRPATGAGAIAAAEATARARVADLSALLHSACHHGGEAPRPNESARARTFGKAVALSAPGSEGDDEHVLATLLALYGGSHRLRILFGSLEHPRVLLTRDAADAARVTAPPAEAADQQGGQQGGSQYMWGAIEEAVAASGMPPHIQAAVMETAERQGDPAMLPNDLVGKALCLRFDAVLALLVRAWDVARRQQERMLESRFDEVDPIGNGTLTLPDLWKCLHRLLRAMVGAGGEMRRRAQPWLERGAAERLYDQMLVESQLLSPTLREGELSRDAFVRVLLRHGIVDVGYEAWLKVHPGDLHPLPADIFQLKESLRSQGGPTGELALANQKSGQKGSQSI
jgi:hypothetical protein